jgi:hypothetical protein
MKKYAELGTVHRGEPCQEYPGEWLVYSGKQEKSFDSFEKAKAWAETEVEILFTIEAVEPPRVSICWKCSDNDPRVGQVWFTGFYQHGKFNIFGSYIS